MECLIICTGVRREQVLLWKEILQLILQNIFMTVQIEGKIILFRRLTKKEKTGFMHYLKRLRH